MTIYLIGILPGAIAGTALAWMFLKNEGYYFDERVRKLLTIGGVLSCTFIIGPLISYMYSFRFEREGADALWGHGWITTLPALIIYILVLLADRTGWKTYIPHGLLFIFALGWLLPIIYNWLAV